MESIKVLSPTAILGYGFPEESFFEGVKRNPDVIAVDAGSTDPGPYYLGSGKSFTDRNSVKRDLEYMLGASVSNKIPLIIGTAGGSGADSHLDWNVEIIKEIAQEKNLDFKIAIISAEISKNVVKEKLANDKIILLNGTSPLTIDEIDNATRIVGQMGTEPFIKALELGADVIIAGRTYDPVVFACLAIKKGFPEGLALHMGKILECATIAAMPGSGSDCMLGTLYKDKFVLEPLAQNRKCTELSVAAHTLYEKSNPYILPGPGGSLDLTETEFKQESDRATAVFGTKFVKSETYTIKLEGAKKVGHRTVSFAATNDPIMISQIDDIISQVKERVENNFKKFGIENFFLDFKIYGKNGTMGIFQNIENDVSHELGIIIEAVSDTSEQSATICSFARSTLLHFGYDGRKSTAGNLAFPFSPSDFNAGEVFVFNIYHLIEVETDEMNEYFPVKIYDCVKGEFK